MILHEAPTLKELMLTWNVGLLVIHQTAWRVLDLGLVLRLLAAIAKELLMKRRRLIDLDDMILVKPIVISLARIQCIMSFNALKRIHDALLQLMRFEH